MDSAIITTTINVPHFLETHALNAINFEHRDVMFIVIGDKKTPSDTGAFCRDLGRRHPYQFMFMSVEDQESFLQDYPELKGHLPYNSIQRRNIGMLLAYLQGADLLITVDDDNFADVDDFVGHHSRVGCTTDIEVFSSSDGWLNVCDFLIEEQGYPFYHRGFPLEARLVDKPRVTSEVSSGTIVVNAGLWLGQPDIDAVTRITWPVNVTGFKRRKNFAVGVGTWSPFNSQNTALARHSLPAYFLSPQIGRYDDIWASYVIKAIADHLNEFVSFGFPLVRQERNPHDSMVDLQNEMDGMRFTNAFCERLRGIELSGSSYQECYREIYDCLLHWTLENRDPNDLSRDFIARYVAGMGVWMKTMDRISRQS